jgi:glycine/D-amino acid oxidase-like deaminating enzyme
VTTPYWLDEPAPTWPPGDATGHVDVGIVGAGVTGCACALALAEAGLRVRVVDERRVAEGASGRNGGFALRGTAAPYDEAVASFGRERALALWRWTEDEIDELERLAGDAFRRVGSLRLAADGEEREDLRDELEGLRADGLEAEWIDAPAGPLAGRFTAAIRHPTDGVLQPARWVRRLAGLAAAAGAELVEGRRITDPAELAADTVVVATDGYPSGLLGELEGLIVPTRGQVIATEPLDERLFEVPHYGRHGFDYWHQAGDGRLVAGGFRDVALEQEFTADEEVTDDVQRALERFVGELVGRRLRVDYRWAGIFGLVLDFMPVVGQVPGADAAWGVGGYSGHGNVLGFACGRLAARAILDDRDSLLDLFEPARLLGE